MNWLDIVIVAVTVTATLLGIKNGLIRAVASLVGLFVAVGTGVLSIPFGASLLIDLIPNSNAAAIVSFSVVTLTIFGLALGAIWLLAKVVDKIPVVNSLNRIGGGLLALVQSGIGALALQVLLKSFPLSFMETAIQGSAIMMVMSGLASLIVGLLSA